MARVGGRKTDAIPTNMIICNDNHVIYVHGDAAIHQCRIKNRSNLTVSVVYVNCFFFSLVKGGHIRWLE
jgi:hypothetical protein